MNTINKSKKKEDLDAVQEEKKKPRQKVKIIITLI